MPKKNKCAGKYLIVFDTICEGNQVGLKDENEKPVLFNNYEEAFKELFDGALSMLVNRSEAELKEYNEGVTPAIVNLMKKIYDSGDVISMQTFLKTYPNCNDNNEWVEKVDEFILGRKVIFTGK